MGAFILTIGDEDAAPAEKVLVDGGFAPAWRHSEPGLALALFRKLNGKGGLVVIGDDGDVACVVGTLIYDGQGGRPALAGLLRDFHPDAIPWQRSRGTWCAVLRKRGTWYVVRDRLDVVKVYGDTARTVLTNSFIALCAVRRAGGLDAQGCYEYVWNGTVFGTKTPFSGIASLPFDTVAAIRSGTVTLIRHPQQFAVEPGPADVDAAAAAALARLRALFAVYAHLWPRSIRSALSGGYDSRLLLALMAEAGIAPKLFVYGDADCADVRVAKAICAGQGLALDHIDKDGQPPVPPERFAAELAADAVAFDGWSNAGLFDGGADRRDRLARSDGRQVLMNGSVGECFRNFYYLRDGRFSLRDLVRTFHSAYDPAAATKAFDAEAYEEALTADIAIAIGAPARGRLPRAAIEMAYPLVRGRYWTARDAALNQRFGTAVFPFLEPAVFDGSWNIPLAVKNFGRLEGRMIARLSPCLAAYGSVYGFPLDGAPPWGYRLRRSLDHWRPVALRRLSYRLQHRRPGPRPWPLRPEVLRTALDPAFPLLRRLFVPERVHHPEAFNRLCTLEYLAERFGVG
ncbi:MAG: hypothetical protein HY985_13535 [Magnetospirillum sp.]|nr:hypothetical protein [Magnetospirillum sp.]